MMLTFINHDLHQQVFTMLADICVVYEAVLGANVGDKPLAMQISIGNIFTTFMSVRPIKQVRVTSVTIYSRAVDWLY